MQRQLNEVVRQLDTRREQVLVEAIVAEVSDATANKLGVQFLLAGLPGSGVPTFATSFSNSAPNLLTIAGAIGARQLNTTTTTVNGTTVTTSTNSAVSDSACPVGDQFDPRREWRFWRRRVQYRQECDFRIDHQCGEIRHHLEPASGAVADYARQSAGADPGRSGNSDHYWSAAVDQFRQCLPHGAA
ncbi:hypothetical protein [Sphingomonas alpina]|uniref:hypothetical protein n=1 Tax=Sphingomonas alpina TaxID=653931 RepID=UPI002DD7B285|nr:hypothetical protein [Sphingomonas alpina]